MKTIIASLLLFSSFSFAGPIFLKATTFVEFAPVPGLRVLTIDGGGKVEFQSPDPTRNGGTVTKPLAQLTVQALAKLKADVAQLNSRSPLQDQDPKAPHCVDAPSVNMFAYQGDIEVRFYSFDACHTFYQEDGGGYGLAELLKGLQYLAE